MFSNTETGVVIFGMAVVTYLTRASGFYLVSRVKVSGKLEAFLNAIPGTVLVSLVAPVVLADGPAESIASLAVVLTAWKSRNLPLAMVVGIVTVWVLRRFIG
ncbi:MAG: AzlD domain-containing protein [Deltaproteobacteria bacterium]|nr:AzlD domain-containing protein [Deltaproteobacteria bacterium]MBI2341305.1 AzlD domain-containing protein [Deltaproteobacteria bacterium]